MSEVENKEQEKKPSVVEGALKELVISSAKLKVLSNQLSKKQLLRALLSSVNGYEVHDKYYSLTDAGTKPKNNIENNASQLIGNLITSKTILLASLLEANKQQSNEGVINGEETMAETGND